MVTRRSFVATLAGALVATRVHSQEDSMAGVTAKILHVDLTTGETRHVRLRRRAAQRARRGQRLTHLFRYDEAPDLDAARRESDVFVISSPDTEIFWSATRCVAPTAFA
jgi:hypothetical protein